MKHFIRTLSLVLALIMAVMMPLEIFAADKGTKYISELVTVAAKSAEEAKTKLEAAGYKMVEGNLNSTFKTGVYLGYKETDDKKEAITDIAAMNMLGKFNYSDYDRIMKDYRENIENVVVEVESFIEDYQMGYANETKNAALAYTALNLFSDGNGKLMGDYFLDYDFSEEANKSLTDTLMKANDNIVMSMIRSLSFAGDPDDTTLISRLSDFGPNVLEKEYDKNYPTYAAFEQGMAKLYGSGADKLYKDWNYFYDYLLDIEKNIAVADEKGVVELKEDAFEPEKSDEVYTEGLNDEQTDVLKELDSMSEVPEVLDKTTDFGFYRLLANSKYGDKTLLDFFKRPSAEISKTELYPVVFCMSESQQKQLDFVGIKEILQSAFSAEEEADAEGEASDAVARYEELTGSLEPVSVFDGVDTSIFTDGVAFTSSATNHEVISKASWLEKLGGIVSGDSSYWNTMTITCWASTCALTVIGVTATVIRKSALKKLPDVKAKFEAAEKLYEDKYEKFLDRWDGGCRAFSRAENEILFAEHSPQYTLKYNYCADKYLSVQRTVKFTMVIKIASFALLFIALGYDIYTLVDYLMKDDPEEEKIPHHIMATAMTPYGEDYVYYQTVKTTDGDAADVNNHEADAKTGWLVLYTTKDPDAGEAVRAEDIKVMTGKKDFGENASFAHLFNETAAVNLTDALYTGKEDGAKGTYIVFEREEPSEYTASAISGGVAAIIAAAALIVGAAGGSIVTSCIKKKKSEK